MYDDARKITLINLDICERNNWINSVCLCYRVLGDLDANIGQHDNARSNYEKALENVQNISNQPVLIQILSAIGSWCARWDKVTTAEDYLNKALRYAVKGGYQLYKVDIYIGLAWMYFISGNTRKSEEKAQSAKQMSEEMGYYWGKLDAEQLLSLNFSQTLSG
ncbi:MAG: tetratricopeptide repeat protein [Nodosilinea sp.]